MRKTIKSIAKSIRKKIYYHDYLIAFFIASLLFAFLLIFPFIISGVSARPVKTNQILNPGFELGNLHDDPPQNWLSWNGPPGSNWTVKDDQKYAGDRSARANINTKKYLQQNFSISIEKSNISDFTFWARTTKLHGTGAEIIIDLFWNGTGHETGANMNLTNTWEQIDVTELSNFYAEPSNSFLEGFEVWNNVVDIGAGDYMWLDDFIVNAWVDPEPEKLSFPPVESYIMIGMGFGGLLCIMLTPWALILFLRKRQEHMLAYVFFMFLLGCALVIGWLWG